MKKLILSLFLTTFAHSALSCTPYDPEAQILDSRATERLLTKIGTGLAAKCTIPYDTDGAGWGIEIRYTDYDQDERRSGTVTRAFTGQAVCTREDSSVVERKISGTVKMKYWEHPSDGSSCDGALMISVKKFSLRATTSLL
ncbi:MAG TPA: hypothetical protein VNJ01_17875 [Bacteriovoracaceae bacterium]|nr:hypothetical protein [Bacteriovoracaceae bacterium]